MISPIYDARLTFAVGPRELREFRMIERHYFRDQVPTDIIFLGTVHMIRKQSFLLNFLAKLNY